MKKLITFIMAVVIILATSVSAFAVTVYVSSMSDIPYFYSVVSDDTINLLSQEDVVARYRELSRAGWPVSYTRVSLSSGSYTAITLDSDVSVEVKSGDSYVGYGNCNAGWYFGNSYGAFVYDNSVGYTMSAIAGAGSYYLTDRPIGTTGNGYGGDLYVPYDNWMNIKSRLTDIGGQYSYYPFIYSVDGEMRYYIASLIGGQKYFVCNNSGQLYYTVKEEAGTGGDGDGSTFDDTEIISALNSVYDALDIGFYDVCNWLEAIQMIFDVFGGLFRKVVGLFR